MVAHLPHHHRGSRPAAAAAELALVLPVLVFLALIALDFGRVYYYSSILATCARNGAYYGCDPHRAPPGPYTSIAQAAQADAANLSPAPTVTTRYSSAYQGPYNLTTPPLNVQNQPSGYIEVTVSWTFNTVVPYPAIPSQSTLSRRVRMRMVEM